MSDGSNIRRPALGEPPPSGRQEPPENARCTDLDGLTPDQIVEKYTRLVLFWANRTKHWNDGLPKADRAQEGFIGLLEAAKRFDPERGARFATYAGYWVHNRIREAAYKTVSTIRIPAYMWKSGGRPPVIASLNAPLGQGGETLYDRVHAREPEPSIADHHDVQKLLARVSDPRDRDCLWRHVALGEQLRRIGESLGVTGERIRQLTARAIRRLRGETPPLPKPREPKAQPVEPGQKLCTRCSQVQLAAAFCRSSRSGDGLRSWCRTCCKVAAAERRALSSPSRTA